MSNVAILATVLAVNGNTSYLLCSPRVTRTFNCENTILKGEWWLEPYICASGICYRKWATAAEAGDSAIQAVEVLTALDGESFFLSGTIADYNAKCDLCCGSTPTLTPIAIPTWIPCTNICADADGNYIFSSRVQTLASGQTMTLTFYADSTLVGTSSAVASPAAALAYALANWDDYGTWSLNGNTLILTSTTVQCATVIVALTEKSYCLTVSYPFTFDEITRSGDNGATISYPLDPAKTVANEAALDTLLTPYFTDGTVTHAVSGKVQYTGTGRPFLLKLADSTVGTWTTAACS